MKSKEDEARGRSIKSREKIAALNVKKSIEKVVIKEKENNIAHNESLNTDINNKKEIIIETVNTTQASEINKNLLLEVPNSNISKLNPNNKKNERLKPSKIETLTEIFDNNLSLIAEFSDDKTKFNLMLVNKKSNGLVKNFLKNKFISILDSTNNSILQLKQVNLIFI